MPVDEPTLLYCERVVELLIDLETQLPTRRYVNTLLDDHQVVVCSRLAPCMARADTTLLQQLSDRLAFYAKFEINDQTGLALTDLEMTEAHCAQLIHLQHTAFKHFKDIFPELPLANLGSIESRADLLWHLEPVDAAHLARLADAVNIRSQPIVNVGLDTKQYLLECLVAKYEKRPSQVEKVNAMPLYPNEVRPAPNTSNSASWTEPLLTVPYRKLSSATPSFNLNSTPATAHWRCPS